MSSYVNVGIVVCMFFLCVKLLGVFNDYSFEAPVSCQAIGELVVVVSSDTHRHQNGAHIMLIQVIWPA